MKIALQQELMAIKIIIQVKAQAPLMFLSEMETPGASKLI